MKRRQKRKGGFLDGDLGIVEGAQADVRRSEAVRCLIDQEKGAIAFLPLKIPGEKRGDVLDEVCIAGVEKDQDRGLPGSAGLAHQGAGVILGAQPLRTFLVTACHAGGAFAQAKNEVVGPLYDQGDEGGLAALVAEISQFVCLAGLLHHDYHAAQTACYSGILDEGPRDYSQQGPDEGGFAAAREEGECGYGIGTGGQNGLSRRTQRFPLPRQVCDAPRLEEVVQRGDGFIQ